jgi:hypothetical protein
MDLVQVASVSVEQQHTAHECTRVCETMGKQGSHDRLCKRGECARLNKVLTPCDSYKALGTAGQQGSRAELCAACGTVEQQRMRQVSSEGAMQVAQQTGPQGAGHSSAHAPRT